MVFGLPLRLLVTVEADSMVLAIVFSETFNVDEVTLLGPALSELITAKQTHVIRSHTFGSYGNGMVSLTLRAFL